MISFRDTTFCNESSCKNWDVCPRALKEEVKKQAHKWWGSEEAPIAIFTDKPKCYEPNREVQKLEE